MSDAVAVHVRARVRREPQGAEGAGSRHRYDGAHGCSRSAGKIHADYLHGIISGRSANEYVPTLRSEADRAIAGFDASHGFGWAARRIDRIQLTLAVGIA